jgi:hypothetical protein
MNHYEHLVVTSRRNGTLYGQNLTDNTMEDV